CLRPACIPLATRRRKTDADVSPVQLPPARVTARMRDGRPISGRLVWPEFVVHSRLSEEEAALSTPKLESRFGAPEVSWTISPGLLGGLALSAAVLLVLGAGVLVASVALGDVRRLRV